jgi:DNA processing protein
MDYLDKILYLSLASYTFLSRPSQLRTGKKIQDWLKYKTIFPDISDLDSILQNNTNSDSFKKFKKKFLEKKTTWENLISSNKIKTITFWDVSFPKKLKEIEFPPFVLFYLGSLPCSFSSIGIVGTRNPSSYGKSLVPHVLSECAKSTIQTISGLADGIDELAHEVSLELGLKTHAVIGSGLLNLQKEYLVQKIILNEGSIISEYLPDFQPMPYYYPYRNRIITGLCDVLWIVQGSKNSGTSHSLKHALDQNKIIAVTPGSIYDSLSYIPHQALKDGAHLIQSGTDLKEILIDIRAVY